MALYNIVKERWKEIEGTNGKYYISTCGRIISTQRNLILKPLYHSKGYIMNRLPINNIWKTIRTHREVAKAFIPNPENKAEVNHKDGIKSNNNISNLEWCTPKENCRHAFSTGLSSNKGSKNSHAKLNENDVIFIRENFNKALNVKELADKFNVKCSAIHKIINRLTWKNI